MPLCPNIYRRGGIYWYRKKFAVSTAYSNVIALSTRIRDPRMARMIGIRLNAEALILARQMETGMITIEEGRTRLETVVTTSFAFAEDALDGLRSSPHSKLSEPEPTYNTDQERTILLAIARESETRLNQEASFNRSHHSLANLGQDVVANAVAMEIAIGHLYQIVARRGNLAIMEDVERANLAKRGVSRDMVVIVEKELVFHARHELGTSWTLGPDRKYFEKHLSEAGVEANDGNIIRLRRTYLELYAELLFDAGRRYETNMSPIRDTLDLLRMQKAGATAVSDVPVSITGIDTIGTRIREETFAVSPTAIVSATPPAPPPITSSSLLSASPMSFIETIRTLATRKLKAKRTGKSDGWTDKTAAQHMSIAALFTKFAGTDDAYHLKQEHIGGYRVLLDLLPKNYGKSSADAERSIDEILARCEDLDDDEVGLEGGTVNRHLTQLGNCLVELRSHGANIGVIDPKLRADDTPKMRASFTIEDRQTLFSSSIWTGDDIIHGSAYFVPLIGHEDCARLGEITGLLRDDVDIKNKFIHIRPNKLRGVKNKASIRRLPIMPEADRLGFFEYLAEIEALGYKEVFPDLRLRGQATALSNLFYKVWTGVLSVALPDARDQSKSFHSFRKTGNTEMGLANVNDPLRYQIMGHAYRDVNGRNYLDEIPVDFKRAALAHIPIVTSSIKALPIRLHPGLRGQ